jgi:hypothetical protein
MNGKLISLEEYRRRRMTAPSAFDHMTSHEIDVFAVRFAFWLFLDREKALKMLREMVQK